MVTVRVSINIKLLVLHFIHLYSVDGAIDRLIIVRIAHTRCTA